MVKTFEKFVKAAMVVVGLPPFQCKEIIAQIWDLAAHGEFHRAARYGGHSATLQEDAKDFVDRLRNINKHARQAHLQLVEASFHKLVRCLAIIAEAVAAPSRSVPKPEDLDDHRICDAYNNLRPTAELKHAAACDESEKRERLLLERFCNARKVPCPEPVFAGRSLPELHHEEFPELHHEDFSVLIDARQYIQKQRDLPKV